MLKGRSKRRGRSGKIRKRKKKEKRKVYENRRKIRGTQSFISNTQTLNTQSYII